MIRTQIQLTPEQAAALRAMSAQRHLSVAELIRISVDSFVAREAGAGVERKRARAASVVGRFVSRAGNVSVEHDRYLAEAFLKP
jgi:hypothetical protein